MRTFQEILQKVKKFFQKSIDKPKDICYNIIVARQAGMAQSVEHVIGNDEVISSILITSSKKKEQRQKPLFFLFRNFNRTNCTNRLRLVEFAEGRQREKESFAANVSSDSDYRSQTEAKASVLSFSKLQ